MKRFSLLLVIAAMLPDSASQAADWVPLADAGPDDQFLYDRSKLVIKDEEITYWKKIIFLVPQNINGHEIYSSLMHERIHCGEHTIKRLAHLHYSTSGEPVDYVSQPEAGSEPIIPDSADDASERVLCQQVWRHQEEARIKAEQKATSTELAAETEEMAKTEGVQETGIRPPQPAMHADPASDSQAAEQLY